MKVGVLALQGDVPEHRRALSGLVPPVDIVAVRHPRDLTDLEAILMPGGESTTIAALLRETGLWAPLLDRLRQGLGALATCAGLIVLARELEPGPTGKDPPTMGLLDVKVRRNDYGPQRESFEAPVKVDGLGGPAFPGVFIRAPRILKVGEKASPFAHRGREVVGIRSGRLWGLTFHPELTVDPRIHELFLSQLRRGG